MSGWRKGVPTETGWFWRRWRNEPTDVWVYLVQFWQDGEDDEGDGADQYTAECEWWPTPIPPPACEEEK